MDITTLLPSIQDGPLEVFDELSRYLGLPILTFIDGSGREHAYVDRRIVPLPEAMAEAGQVEVHERDRLDNIAAAQFGDPRWWWRIADANRALDPVELTGPGYLGRRLRITLPQGVPLARQD
jgi:hypothetical protein